MEIWGSVCREKLPHRLAFWPQKCYNNSVGSKYFRLQINETFCPDLARIRTGRVNEFGSKDRSARL